MTSNEASAESKIGIHDEIEKAFKWKTIFTELAIRGASPIEFVSKKTSAGLKLLREVENLVEAYLNAAAAEEKSSFEKDAEDHCKRVDRDEELQLSDSLRRDFPPQVVQNSHTEQHLDVKIINTHIDQFWKTSSFRPMIIRALAKNYGLDTDLPIEKLRVLVYHKVPRFQTICDMDPFNCGSCTAMCTGQICCNGICVNIPEERNSS